MKSILYVGATLMIGASIYGFVDYKSTSHKKEFTSMYEEKKKTEPVVSTESKKTELVAEKKIASREKKVVIKKQAVNRKEDITSVKHNADDIATATNKVKEIEKPVVNVPVSKDSNVEKKVAKKKRKISTKMFSRAPIREEPGLPQPAKTELKKIEIKEQ